ncbi:hypothetical protein ABFX02_06G030400 [Erythranthe guttata]
MKNSKLSEENPVTEKRKNAILRHVKKLQEEKPANQKLIMNKILRQVIKLQRESEEKGKLEAMKELEEEKERVMVKKFLEEVLIEKEKKLERDNRFREENQLMKKLYPNAFRLSKHISQLFDRDSSDSYSPEKFQRVKSFAKIAIDVFNQRQVIKKAIKYSVVDVIRASSHMDTGRMVNLTFTAKPDDSEDEDVETFGANIHYGFNKPFRVTHVAYSSA